MIRVILFFLLYVASVRVSAQQISVFGRVADSTGQAVVGANVLIKRLDNGAIAYFQSTKADGTYRMTLPNTIAFNDYFLEVNHLAYEKATLAMSAEKTEYHFSLVERVNKIPEINVNKRPLITQNGDTLRYDVRSFTETMDRSIGDVLKRMPGFEVADNGRITYQGQAISNLYIDGDDLLEGKYSIGTKAIPHVMVQGVEVLRNHQPIKVLEGRVISRDIAINLVIRDEAKLKLSGDIKLGGGLPEQYFAEANTMLFNKKHKLLNVLKGNNIGVDLQDDLTDLVSTANNPSTERKIISTGTVGNPNLPKMRYYLNNSGGLFTNNLVNLSNDWQLKSNIDFFLDRNRLNYLNQSTIFVSGSDSITFDEQLNRILKPLQLDVNLRTTKNVKSNFFDNRLKLTYRMDDTDAALTSGTVGIAQTLRQQQWRFDNSFRYIPLLHNGHVLNIDWNLNGRNLPERLSVLPGSAVSFIDTLGIASALIQHVDVNTLGTRFGMEYILKPTIIRQRYTLGVSQDWQSLGSSMRIDGERDHTQPTFPSNDLHWRKTFLNATGNFHFERTGWKINLNVPIGVQRIAFRDDSHQLDRAQNDILFMPSFFTTVSLGSRQEVEARYGFRNEFGDLHTIYQGAILTNYRTMVANDAVLQERWIHQAGLNYRGGNPISMFFYGLGYTYSNTTFNTIVSLEVTDRQSRIVLVPFRNEVSNHQITTEISKFIFSLGAKSGLRAVFGVSDQNQLVNDELLPYRSQSISLVPDFNVKLLRSIQLSYRGQLSWFRNRPMEQTLPVSQRVFSMNQSLQLSYSPKAFIHLGISGQQLLTDQYGATNFNYIFTDTYARYKVTRWRTEFELNLTNIANVETFGYALLDVNTSLMNQYNIRGRMAVLKVIFNL